ncbi:hypothetical protein KJ965_05585, partial [Patescibacteria group bacterium]|nr:hypothetical protein [Patescibacteria group bacterium]
MIISGLNPFSFRLQPAISRLPASHSSLPPYAWDLVLDWWLTFVQARLSLTRAKKLCSAHMFFIYVPHLSAPAGRSSVLSERDTPLSHREEEQQPSAACALLQSGFVG